jgi:hypothetical protein
MTRNRNETVIAPAPCTRSGEQQALTVQPVVGCAADVIQTWIKGKNAACRGDIGCY